MDINILLMYFLRYMDYHLHNLFVFFFDRYPFSLFNFPSSILFVRLETGTFNISIQVTCNLSLASVSFLSF